MDGLNGSTCRLPSDRQRRLIEQGKGHFCRHAAVCDCGHRAAVPTRVASLFRCLWGHEAWAPFVEVAAARCRRRT
jgi:hypothetical protein